MGLNGTGISKLTYETTPVKVLEDVATASVDMLAYGVKTDGTLWGWGPYAIGTGSKTNYKAKPVQVLEDVVHVCEIGNRSHAIATNGELYQWGNESSYAPTKMLEHVASVDILEGFYSMKYMRATYATTTDGSLYTMGTNVYGELGNGRLDGIRMAAYGKILSNVALDTPVLPAMTLSKTVAANASAVLVDGTEMAFDAYTIDGHNYFKLRDIAAVLSGTAAQFEVTWDGEKSAIDMVSQASYTSVGGELVTGSGGNKTAVMNAASIYLDGQRVFLDAYTINGNNYFKLRDLGEALGFNVSWDNAVVIASDEAYTAD